RDRNEPTWRNRRRSQQLTSCWRSGVGVATARATRSAGLQPAAALEEEEQHDAGHDDAAETEREEGPRAGQGVCDEPAEVLPEEAGDERQRQEDRADDGELLH